MVFKAYDIRGVYKKELDEDFAYSLGKVLGEKYKDKKVLVGMDVREGSKKLAPYFVSGLVESCDVDFAGVISTPLLYFGTKNKYDLGVIITASHNPKEYTGFKMCDRVAIPISPKEEIKPIFKKYKAKEPVNLEDYLVDIKEDYKRFFIKKIGKIDKKIAVDFANGATTIAEKEILEEIVENPIFINDYPDGNFPAHEPDTLKEECLRDIIKKVKEEKCDLGLIFDGDGDRLGMIDNRGRNVRGDILTAIIAREILKEKPNSKIIYDLRCSKVVEETILKYGGIPIKTRVGHYFIKKLMHKEDAEFAGELSNHFYFKEIGYFESPLLALYYVVKANKDLDELADEFNKYYHSGEINFKVDNQKEVLERIKEHFKDCRIEELDGLSVYCKGFWFNIRPSNTEPLLRLNLEADNEEILKEKLEEIKRLITL
ncbi:phosphomannomutase/phosphoglucomutase [Methanocaldococcus indicus]|uniref:phosphomannomutase/phosphoglucomutase n=1 Tax=Methanocaldococcus indicus TaxID=213231 RepID=UPI003C6D192F